jgi:MFS family permease
VVVPLLAAMLTRRSDAVALVAAAGQLPWFLVGPLTGVAADWIDRRLSLWTTGVVRAALAFTFVALVALHLDSIPILAAYAFLLGSAQTLHDGSALAYLPDVVDANDLDRANGLLQSSQLLMMDFAGPPLAGALIAITVTLPLAIDASTFALAAILILLIQTSANPARRIPNNESRGRLRADLREGLHWFLQNPPLLRLCILLGVTNFAVQGVLAIYVLYCTVLLHGPALA